MYDDTMDNCIILYVCMYNPIYFIQKNSVPSEIVFWPYLEFIVPAVSNLFFFPVDLDQ